MTKHTNVILSIVLSFMVLFSAIGYSALTDTLGVDGVATLTPQEIIGIYIYVETMIGFCLGLFFSFLDRIFKITYLGCLK